MDTVHSHDLALTREFLRFAAMDDYFDLGGQKAGFTHHVQDVGIGENQAGLDGEKARALPDLALGARYLQISGGLLDPAREGVPIERLFGGRLGRDLDLLGQRLRRRGWFGCFLGSIGILLGRGIRVRCSVLLGNLSVLRQLLTFGGFRPSAQDGGYDPDHQQRTTAGRHHDPRLVGRSLALWAAMGTGAAGIADGFAAVATAGFAF